MADISDEELWSRFRNGDVLSFEKIYDDYATTLFQYGRNYATNQAFVEDCVQELFTEIWEKRANLGTTTSIRFYLFSSIRRKIFRRLEQEKKRGEHEKKNQLSFRSITTPESDLILNEEGKKIQHLLLEAVNSLPERQREVLFLRYYVGLSFDAITEMLGLPKKTAYNIIFKALETLRKKLNLKDDFPLEMVIALIISSIIVKVAEPV